MIFIIGEYVIDLVDDNNNRYVSHLGGCGLNAAVACNRQGAPTGFVSPISSDVNGSKVVNYLIEEEILFDPDLCNSPHPSTLAMANIKEDGSAQYDFYLQNTASMELDYDRLNKSLNFHTDVKVLHIGSLSLLIEPTSSSILKYITTIDNRPIIFLDPNIRKEEVIKIDNWREKIINFIKIADIIKLSDEDIEVIFEGFVKDNAINEIKKINNKAHIILTKGSEGATWYSPKGNIYNQGNYKIDVKDTIGAGDTFSGSLLAYLYKNSYLGEDEELPSFNIDSKGIVNALKYACYSASLNCSKYGCNPPTNFEVEAIIEK